MVTRAMGKGGCEFDQTARKGNWDETFFGRNGRLREKNSRASHIFIGIICVIPLALMSTAYRGSERRHQSGEGRANEAQYTSNRSANGGGTHDRDDDDEPCADANTHQYDDQDGESGEEDGGAIATARSRAPPPHHSNGNHSPNMDAMGSSHASSSKKSGRSAALPHSSHASQTSHRPAARAATSSSSSSSFSTLPAAVPPRFSCTLNRTEMMTQMLQALHFGKDQLAHLTFQELGIKVQRGAALLSRIFWPLSNSFSADVCECGLIYFV